MNREAALVLVLAINVFYGCGADPKDTGIAVNAGAEKPSQHLAEKNGKRQIISITERPIRVTKDANGVERLGVDFDVTVQER
jgi:hypothetical protein